MAFFLSSLRRLTVISCVTVLLSLVGACGSTTTPSADAGRDSGGHDSGSGSRDSGPMCDGVPPMDGSGGHGSTLGGCPADEPTAGSACTIKGRLCTWLRDCTGAQTTDTGWCTAAGSWQVALGQCAKGCPAAPTGAQSFCGDMGPCDAHCMAGLTCYYPSTPLDTANACTCSASGGATVWPSPGGCNAWNDCWVPAAGSASPKSCSELEACSGSTGCGDSCPNPAPQTCGCGPDGHLYCQVGPKC